MERRDARPDLDGYRVRVVNDTAIRAAFQQPPIGRWSRKPDFRLLGIADVALRVARRFRLPEQGAFPEVLPVLLRQDRIRHQQWSAQFMDGQYRDRERIVCRVDALPEHANHHGPVALLDTELRALQFALLVKEHPDALERVRVLIKRCRVGVRGADANLF